MQYIIVIHFDAESDEDAQLMADDIERDIGDDYDPKLTIYRPSGFTVAGVPVPRS